MATHVDTTALAIEVLRKAGIRAELEPSSKETARTPLVVIQDASPVDVNRRVPGAATTTVIALSTVARSREECATTADAAVTALVQGAGQYTEGRLVRGVATNLPRPVGQNVLSGDNLHQRHAMVKIIVRNITQGD